MTTKIASILMLMLIFAGLLSVNVTVTPPSTKRIESVIPSISERSSDAGQIATLDSTRSSSRYADATNSWNLNQVNEENRFTYPSSNETRLIVGLNWQKPTDLVEVQTAAARHQARIIETVSIGGKIEAVVIEDTVSMTALVNDIRAMNLASYMEPNMKAQTQFTPNDPYWTGQWGPQKIGADWTWNTTVGDSSVLVAVVDTGIDYTHPDLAPNYVPLGYDWVNRDNDPKDDFGHGTHVAGTIAAVTNNSIGIAGLAQVRIMAEKVLGSDGGGYWSWIANGIVHATDQGARIISMSFGGYVDSILLHRAIEYAYDAGVLLVAAAGNNFTRSKGYPAGYDEVIAVAATDQNDQRAWFSNWGYWIELSAPGVDVYSTMPTYRVTMNDRGYDMNYDNASGTSMACPHVSGVAALLWSLYPTKSRDWIRAWLDYTADDLGDLGFDEYYGYGRVNARKAFEQQPPPHELVAYSWKTPPYVELGASGKINATILNFGDSNEANVTVELSANGTIIDSATIDLFSAGSSTTARFLWNPLAHGLYNLTLYLVPLEGETHIANNVLWRYGYAGSPLKAVILHSAGNELGDSIDNWEALNNEWYRFGNKAIYIDYTTLDKEEITYQDIAATKADVLIISCAFEPSMGWEFTDQEIEAITQYVLEGHGLVVTAGTIYFMVPNNNKLAPLLGMNEKTVLAAWNTSLLSLIEPAHPIFTNIPNPLVLPRGTQTAVPLDEHWGSDNLKGGTYLALGGRRESTIITYRGLVYISPWLEIIPPNSYSFHLQLLYNAISWSRYQKPQHDLVAYLEAPLALKPGQSTLLNTTVSNIGLNNETNVEVRLLVNGKVINTTTFPELRIGDSYTSSYHWGSLTEGVYDMTAYVPPVLGEQDTKNNVKSSKTLVSNFSVLLLQDDDSWDYPSNQIALERYNVPYIVAGSEYFGKVDLGVFAKVIIASFQDQQFYNRINTHLGWFEDYANSGGILEIHAVDRGGSWGSWVGRLPGGLKWLEFYRDLVSAVDLTHPVLNTPNTITEAELDYWYYSSGGSFSGYPEDADIVIIEDSTRMPVFLEFGYGAGFIVASSLPLEWAYQNGYSHILENSLLYMPTKHEHDVAVTLDAPAFLDSGSSVLINATVRNRGVNDETNVPVELMINGTLVDSELFPKLTNASSCKLSYLWSPADGTYNITAYVPPSPDDAATFNNVATRFVKVRPIKHILFDQHGTIEIFFFRGWIASLTNRGYVIETRYVGPITTTLLEKYDVLVIPRPGSRYGEDELSAIQNFVRGGGGLFVTGFGSAAICSDLTSFSGITWRYYLTTEGWNYIATDITPHPVTTGIAAVFFSDPYATLNVTGEAQGLVRDPTQNHNIILAVSEWLGGRVVGFSPMSLSGRLADNIIDWLARWDHNLAASLDAPTSLQPFSTGTLNATVRNSGLYNETNVQVQLMINGTVVYSETIPKLSTGSFHAFSYVWTPTAVGTYNITAYALPATSRDLAPNNIVSETVHVYYYVPPAASFSWLPPAPTNGEPVVFDASSSTPNGGTILRFEWNFDDGNVTTTTGIIITHVYASHGTYNVTLSVYDSEGLTGTIWKIINVLHHDVAVVDVNPSRNWTYEGRSISINVSVANEGNFTETVTVDLYYDIATGKKVGTRIVDLSPSETETLTFIWYTIGVSPCLNYTLTAVASIPSDSDKTNNVFESPMKVKVRALEDVNNDNRIDIKDLTLAALAFGSHTGQLRWNSDADLNKDGQVDVRDLVLIARHFGRTD